MNVGERRATGRPVVAGEQRRLDPLREGRSALQRRLANVSAQAREVLELASVAGRDFVLPHLAGAFARSPEPLHAAILEAEEASLVSKVASGGAYRFRHILLRDVLYQELAAEQRQQLHFQLARWLETYNVDRAAMPWSEIAHHYFASGEQGRDADGVRGVRHRVATGQARDAGAMQHVRTGVVEQRMHAHAPGLPPSGAAQDVRSGGHRMAAGDDVVHQHRRAPGRGRPGGQAHVHVTVAAPFLGHHDVGRAHATGDVGHPLLAFAVRTDDDR